MKCFQGWRRVEKLSETSAEGDTAPAEAAKGVTGPVQVERLASASGEDFTTETNNRIDNKLHKGPLKRLFTFYKVPPHYMGSHKYRSPFNTQTLNITLVKESVS